MSERVSDLANVEMFQTLTAAEIEEISTLAEPIRWGPGEKVYALGDPGGSMFAVLTGAVELFGVVGGVEKLFVTVRDGGVFGLLTMLDEGSRPGNARALEETKALVIDRRALDSLLADRPTVGIRVLQGVGKVLGRRVRALTDQYKATVEWNLQITGLSSLSLDRLMTDRVEIQVETLRGEPLSGTLVRFEQSAAGHELFLRDPEGRIHIVPYHAMTRLSVMEDDVHVATAPEL